MGEDQREAIAFLADPASYGGRVERVERIETHISLVFLAGPCAYKLKRAVRYPYLDFTTAARRRAACEAELALNRRTAPAIYREVRGLVRRQGGRIAFGGGDAAIDWVVVMTRFEQSLLFDALARAGRLTAPLIDALADHIARFHEAAERRPQFGGAAALAAVAEENHQCLSAAEGAGFDRRQVAAVGDRTRATLARLAPLLDRRRDAGKVRRVHGDLHLRNICLFEGRPTLFDCIEFSEPLASIDVLYDLAFLLMDLEHCGLAGFANRVLNRYFDVFEPAADGEEEGLAALPLYLSLRAVIRAHVTASTLAHAEAAGRAAAAAEARQYLDLAGRLLDPASPRLVALGGPSGSGKTTLALALAPGLGARPGARVLRSDVVRKTLAGLAPEERLPASAYTEEASRRVYAALCGKAAAALAAGHSVILDAVALLPEERAQFAEVARRAAAPFTGIWLEAPAETMAARIRARHADASDATEAVLALQLAQDPGPIDWPVLDAGAGAEATLAAARHILGDASLR
ncbi:MAG TPA: AAA family ATPase [Stellaceae bacterium]|nr:AAA family ATPase [Stellaceae bacterium]